MEYWHFWCEQTMGWGKKRGMRSICLVSRSMYWDGNNVERIAAPRLGEACQIEGLKSRWKKVVLVPEWGTHMFWAQQQESYGQCMFRGLSVDVWKTAGGRSCSYNVYEVPGQSSSTGSTRERGGRERGNVTYWLVGERGGKEGRIAWCCVSELQSRETHVCVDTLNPNYRRDTDEWI